MQTKTYYLAGPMTGYPELNVPAFKAAKEVLEGTGMRIQLPIDIDNEISYWSWGDYLGEDIKIILNECQGMVLLPGWAKSRGAKLEIAAGLMKSLKDTNFQFMIYIPEEKKALPIVAPSIELAWHQNWSSYVKESKVA